MSDARWLDVDDDLASAVFHFGRSVEIFNAGGFEGEGLSAYKSRMALMQSMQSGYSSLELALERVFEILGEEKPGGPNYHADLIRRARRDIEGDRPAILPHQLAEAVDEARRFRHVARRTYDDFRPDAAAPALQAAAVIRDQIVDAIAKFRRAVG
jgi:hypothetical protein